MGDGFDLSKIVGFDWDKGNLEHIEKHNVNYRECEEAFLNKSLIVMKTKLILKQKKDIEFMDKRIRKG